MTKQALITGGTKGIGRAVADVLARAGYDLTLTYGADTVAAEEAAEAIRTASAVRVDLLQADITDPASIARVASHFEASDATLDAVVLNAGTTYRASFEELELAEWERQFFANVHFPVFLLQRLVKRIRRGAGVVFTGSLMAVEPHGMSLSYGVTKSAVHALAKNLVKFLAPYGRASSTPIGTAPSPPRCVATSKGRSPSAASVAPRKWPRSTGCWSRTVI